MPIAVRRVVSLVALLAFTLLVAYGSGSVASSATVVQGDADCSGTVAAPDALGILGNASAGRPLGCADSADTNCDNHVDARDALNVLLYVSGASPNLPEYCTAMADALPLTQIAIDTSLHPDPATIDALDGGPPNTVHEIVDPSGVTTLFADQEMIYKPDNDQDLQQFLAATHGTVVRDGTFQLPAEAGIASSNSINDGYYLIAVDPDQGGLGDLAGHISDAGITGKVVLDSVGAATLLDIATGTPGERAQLSAVGNMNATEDQQTGDSPVNFFDIGSTFQYSGDPPLDINVVGAWSYMRYQQAILAEDAIPFQATRVAIIDTGFALDTSTGLPLGGNLDFFPQGLRPSQYDAQDEDYTAGGEATASCGDPAGCPWHGIQAASACCAIVDNHYGSGGTANNYVVPIMIKIDGHVSVWADAIRAAELLEADVMSMSFSYSCDHFCGWFDGDIGDAVDHAGHAGRIQVAAAGNDGVDIGGDDHFRPCEFVKTICVGGMNAGKTNLRNFGSPVDIWAPEDLTTTVTPVSSAKDDNNIGSDELTHFNGTSAATPFVAGIVAMMKSLNPDLTYVDVLRILGDTALPATDPKISKGYINAMAAVQAAKPNLPPVITNVRAPQSKETYGYAGIDFRVDVYDPEPGSLDPEFNNGMFATFEFNGQTICSSSQLTYRDGIPGFDCFPSNVTPGTGDVIITVTDYFGAVDMARINEVHIVNHPPIVDIIEPEDGETHYSNESLRFSAYVFDAEETIPFPQDQIVWSSNIDGVIGTGDTINSALSQGENTVTITATDSKGTSTSQSITLHIQSGAGVPTVGIDNPHEGDSFGGGQQITFQGHGFDTEDGTLSGNSLQWYDNIDGYLGSGTQITAVLSGNPTCNNPYWPHTITLHAIDSDNHNVTAHVHISLSIIC
ncbi:MAG: S8/S53 family peptidase [Chloroflexota bacterium]